MKIFLFHFAPRYLQHQGHSNFRIPFGSTKNAPLFFREVLNYSCKVVYCKVWFELFLILPCVYTVYKLFMIIIYLADVYWLTRLLRCVNGQRCETSLNTGSVSNPVVFKFAERFQDNKEANQIQKFIRCDGVRSWINNSRCSLETQFALVLI